MVDSLREIRAQLEGERPYDAGDQAAITAQTKRVAQKEAARHKVVENLMSTVAGRDWMYGLIEFCNVYGNPFIQGSPDGTAFNLGMQNVGKRLLDEINKAAPEKYMPMLREAKQE